MEVWLGLCGGDGYYDGAVHLVHGSDYCLAVSWTPWNVLTPRTQFRKQANAADNKGATVAVDSLINYEAVKAFNNEKYEIKQYDATLKTYEKASIKIATSLAFLNSGQNFIFSSALTMMMVLGAQGIIKGEYECTADG